MPCPASAAPQCYAGHSRTCALSLPPAGDLPNVYVYACNNPSESIIAKRRGYGVMVSHNVPPYGRAGLYKQLAELRALLQVCARWRRGELGPSRGGRWLQACGRAVAAAC